MNNKRRKKEKINKKVLIVTVDIGKELNTGYWRIRDFSEGKVLGFKNNLKGFENFWQRICKVRDNFKMEKILIGFESTGSYGEPLIHYLRGKLVKLVQINPVNTKSLKKLRDNSPGKTDKKDPIVIADVIELGYYMSVITPSGTFAELRRLSNSREHTISRKTASMNHLQNMVFTIFPEFLKIMKGVSSASSLYLLKHYTTPEAIKNLGSDKLGNILKSVSRGKLGLDRAKDLYESAVRSVGIREGLEGIVMDIRKDVNDIQSDSNFIKEIETKMKIHLEDIPYSKYLLSIKGVGEVTVSGIIGEVGDFRLYHHRRELLKLAGLNLYEISSGKHKGIRRISKHGRSLLRKFLYYASLNAIRKGGIMHEYYQRLTVNGMIKTKALIAVSRKILCLMFALVRDNSYYDQENKIKKAA